MSLDAGTWLEDGGEDSAAEAAIGRRTAPRLAVRVPARFRIGEIVVDVVIIDVSATGARLHMPCPPPTGRDGVLVWQGSECSCRVVWTGKGSFGVAFHQAMPTLAEQVRSGCPKSATITPLPAPAMAEPQAWTLPTSSARPGALGRPAEVRQGDRWIKVVLKGISRHGFEIGWFPRCRDQAPISLRGPGLPLLHGRVVASDQVVVRCKLRAPLHDAVLGHILGQAAG